MKDSFILYTEQKEVVDKLSDEQAGKLFKAIYEYAETKKMPQIDSLLDIVVIPFKQCIDRNTEKWEETKQKRSEAGKLGAEIKKQKQANEANAKFAKHSEANLAVNVNDSVNVNVNDSVNVNDDVVGDSCVDGLQKVIDFYNANIGLITPYGMSLLESYLNQMDYEVIIFAMQKAVEANVRTIQYIKGTLNNWSKKGIKTLLQAQEENEAFKQEKSQKGKGELNSNLEEWLKEREAKK